MADIDDFAMNATRLKFLRAPPVRERKLKTLEEILRRKVLKRLQRKGILPQETVEGMPAWPHSGLCLDASVRVEAEDRAGLDRVVGYCTRPAIALKRLEYRAKEERVRSHVAKGPAGGRRVLEWSGMEFLKRMSRLRRHLVRYARALGPRAALRKAVTQEARDRAPYAELLAGWTPAVPLK
jgi:hypothetical protein